MVASCAKAWGVSCKLQGYRFQDKKYVLLFTAVDPVHGINLFFSCLLRWIPCTPHILLQYDARHARMVAGCRASSRGCSAVYILLFWYFVLLRLAQAILSCMPQAPPCGDGARGGDAASCTCNTANTCDGALASCAISIGRRTQHHSSGARGGDAASCTCNTAIAACDVARLRRSDGGRSACWQWLARPCWLCPKHKACTSDTAGNATSCKRFHCLRCCRKACARRFWWWWWC